MAAPITMIHHPLKPPSTHHAATTCTPAADATTSRSATAGSTATCEATAGSAPFSFLLVAGGPESVDLALEPLDRVLLLQGVERQFLDFLEQQNLEFTQVYSSSLRIFLR